MNQHELITYEEFVAGREYSMVATLQHVQIAFSQVERAKLFSFKWFGLSYKAVCWNCQKNWRESIFVRESHDLSKTVWKSLLW